MASSLEIGISREKKLSVDFPVFCLVFEVLLYTVVKRNTSESNCDCSYSYSTSDNPVHRYHSYQYWPFFRGWQQAPKCAVAEMIGPAAYPSVSHGVQQLLVLS